jgi:hypothetical protein
MRVAENLDWKELRREHQQMKRTSGYDVSQLWLGRSARF